MNDYPLAYNESDLSNNNNTLIKTKANQSLVNNVSINYMYNSHKKNKKSKYKLHLINNNKNLSYKTLPVF